VGVMPNQNFAVNLRLICGQYRSVAHVCRSMEMNRQQFNKYLSGKIYPSKHNLSRVCRFFKLSEEQLNLQPEAFGRVVAESFQQEKSKKSSIRYPDLPRH
jgi:DNA-binding phage protein